MLLEMQKQAEREAAESPVPIVEMKIYLDDDGEYRIVLLTQNDFWVRPNQWKIVSRARPGSPWLTLVKGFR